MALGGLLLTAVSGLVRGDSVPAVAARVAPAAETEWTVVRRDATTYVETELGVIAFANRPPFVARFVSGDAGLKTLVAETNALDHVMSTGLSGPGSKILRSEDQYFRIMRGNWLDKQKGVVLQVRPKVAAPSRRFRVYLSKNGKNDELGRVVLNPSHYLQIVESKPGEATHLFKILREVNDHDAMSVDIPPPAGARRGSYGRGVERGSPLFFTLLRDKLLDREDVILCDDARSRKALMHHVVYTGAGSAQIPWLKVEIDKSLNPVPARGTAFELHYADSSGQIAFIIGRYGGVKYTPAAMSDWVTKRFAAEPGFSARPPQLVQVAGRQLLTVALRTGQGNTATDHAIVMWPHSYFTEKENVMLERGFLIEVNTPARGATPDAATIFAHELIAPSLDSLYLNPEWSQ